MFEAMRRQDRALSPEETRELLLRGEYGVLGLQGLNGYPHPVPMSYALEGEVIWLHCALEGSKLADLRADARASFCVVGATEVLPSAFSTRYASAIAYGEVEEVSGAEADRGLMALLEKYSPEHLEAGRAYLERARAKTGVLRLHIAHLSGKSRR
nr:pyridoxamine 5'-phosphate oxidase family protein [uncultured Holophaga sp.]